MFARRCKTIDDVMKGKPGSYCLLEDDEGDQILWIKDPKGNFGRLTLHTITENIDKTVTVSPSIHIDGNEGTWRGYLERDEWRDA